MAGGIMALIGKAPKMPKGDNDEAMSDDSTPDGSAGEMAAEDFANATDAKARYAAFKRMFKACEMEGHDEGPATDESEDDEEAGY